MSHDKRIAGDCVKVPYAAMVFKNGLNSVELIKVFLDDFLERRRFRQAKSHGPRAVNIRRPVVDDALNPRVKGILNVADFKMAFLYYFKNYFFGQFRRHLVGGQTITAIIAQSFLWRLVQSN